MSTRDTRLADAALAAQYELAGLREGNPWYGKVSMELAAIPENQQGLVVAALRANAARASTIAVDTEFTEVVAHAAQDLHFQWMEGDEVPEVLLPYDVPTEQGFVWFAHNITIDATDDYQMGAKGFLWWTTPKGLSFIPFAGRDWWQGVERDNGWSLTEKFGAPPQAVPHDLAGWHFGVPWRLDPNAALGSGKEVVDGISLFNPSAAADRAIIWSFFRLVSQRIPRTEHVRPDRPTRRLLTRKPLLVTESVMEDGHVRLYTLRHEIPETERHEGDGEEVPWSHRWMVGAHWARRRVAIRDDEGNIIGSTQGEEGVDWTYRRVYIRPHVKGPENLPLVLKDAVGILKR